MAFSIFYVWTAVSSLGIRLMPCIDIPFMYYKAMQLQKKRKIASE